METFQSPQRNAFANGLRNRIRRCGQRQRHIAKLAGIEESTISRFMLGKAGLSLKAIEAILDVLKDLEAKQPKE